MPARLKQYEVDPRVTMARLPSWLQSTLTFAIGKPLPGQRLPWLSPMRHLIGFVVLHVCGIAWSVLALGLGGLNLIMLPVGIYFTLVGARHMQVGGIHHMVHGAMSGSRRTDDRMGSVLSLYLLIEEYSSYKRGHVLHHSRELSASTDPTVQSLHAAQLRCGMTVDQLRRRLVLSLVSPRYHLARLVARLRSHLGKSAFHRTSTLLYLLAICVVWWNWPLYFVVAWLLPIVVGYQCVALIRMVIEHWPVATGPDRAHYLERTSAIYCGVPLPERTPSKSRNLEALIRWSLRMTFEVACRALFVSADGPNHDLHHIRPDDSWANDIILRAQVAADRGGRSEPLSETWGFWYTLQLHIDAMSRARDV